MMSRDSLQKIAEDRNSQTRLNCCSFAGHRDMVRGLLQAHSPPEASSLCVLGPGNTNDLDLPWLSTRFRRIVLVDLDEEAVKAGVARQMGSPTPSIQTIAL